METLKGGSPTFFRASCSSCKDVCSDFSRWLAQLTLFLRQVLLSLDQSRFARSQTPVLLPPADGERHDRHQPEQIAKIQS